MSSTYSTAQICELYRISRATLQNWIGKGLNIHETAERRGTDANLFLLADIESFLDATPRIHCERRLLS